MTVLRSEIDKFLSELKFDEGGMKFQDLAVVLAKQKWPELIACERKNDLGLDAHAPAEPSAGRIGKGLAASITPTLSKIFFDAKKVAERTQKHFSDVTMLIFATSQKVTNTKKEEWATQIKDKYGYDLVVISRQDIIISLILPSNAPLCRSFGITAPIEIDAVGLVEKALEAASRLAADRLSESPLKGKPLLPLRAMKLNHEGGETTEILQLHDIKTMLTRSRRIVLEAPAGRGKTTTLVQLADQYAKDGGIALLIDLPAWMISGKDILEFTAGLPHFRSRGIDAQALAKIYAAEHITFLLNGWNEISDNYSEKALTELQQLESTFPAAGIIVATRTHHMTPPLPGALRTRLLPLNRTQRAEYLKNVLGDRSDTLRSKLDNDVVLDQLTRTPLTLSKVADIFSAGLPIPATKIGVLDAVMNLIEQSSEHKNQLQLLPLTGYARAYLSELAMQMLFREEVIIPEQESRPIVGSVSGILRDSGQISTTPEPQAVINALCARHVLERQDYPSVTLRFEHQQFQEFFAALRLKSELLALSQSHDETAIREFTKKYVNEPIWTEPLEMLAEEVGAQDVHDDDTIASGVLLVEMALHVDPIFAANLARLCGDEVWKKVRDGLSSRLRAWYKSSNQDHRDCALAGMVASGSPEFSDIILPLLTSDNQQVRLSVYRKWDEFHLSTLGPDWKSQLISWPENARRNFVSELLHQKWLPEVVEHFSLNDPSIKVRLEAISAMLWTGSNDNLAAILDKVDEETFKLAVQKIHLGAFPLNLAGKACEALRNIYRESTDPIQRLSLLLRCDTLHERVDAILLKNELDKLDFAKLRDIGEFVLKPTFKIVQRTDPAWVSHWTAERIVDGSLWYDHWKDFVTTVPVNLVDTWLQKLSNENLRYKSTSNIIDVLAAGLDKTHTENIFQKLCDLKHATGTPYKKENEDKYEIQRQLRDLFRALSPNVAVDGLRNCFNSSFDGNEFKVIVDLLSTDGQQEDDFCETLDNNLRQDLLAYLKKNLNFALESDDSDGGLIANTAVALSRVGTPEDIRSLIQLVQADVKRLKNNLEARQNGTPVSITSWCHYHIRSLIRLDPVAAEQKVLELLHEPIYEHECAGALIRLAKKDRSDPPFGAYRQGYAKIWDVRTGQNFIEFDEARRINFANAIRERIQSLLIESHSEKDKVSYSIRDLGKSLAILDPKGSTGLIFDVLSLLGEHDDWKLTSTLENLLNGGATMPTNKVSDLFDGMLQRLKKHGSHDDRENLLRHFLCILPFIANPEEGIKKIREAITEFRIPLHIQKDIIDALGYSRCDEAYSLLRELAGSNGEYIKDLGESWLNALAALDTVESKKLLMSFVDPDITEFQNMPNIGRTDILAAHIVTLARNDSNINQRLIGLCDLVLPAEKRSLLAEVISRVDTEGAIMASLNLIDDTANPMIPFSLARKFETSFVERRPHEKSGSTFTLAPRSANAVRKKLFEMSKNDGRRKRTAYALLGKIECWRIDYGKPTGEPRHPNLESGKDWPL